MKEIAIRLAQKVHSLRLEAGVTQAELAASAGVTVETVARLERVLRGRSSANANPSLETLARLSEALGVEIADLVGASPKDKPSDDRLSLILRNSSADVRRLVLKLAEVVARDAYTSPTSSAPVEPVRANGKAPAKAVSSAKASASARATAAKPGKTTAAKPRGADKGSAKSSTTKGTAAKGVAKKRRS